MPSQPQAVAATRDGAAIVACIDSVSSLMYFNNLDPYTLYSVIL